MPSIFSALLRANLIVSTLLLSHAANAAQQELSVQQAQQLAIARSYQLQAQDHAASASQALAEAAKQLPDPVLSMEVANLPVSGSHAWQMDADAMSMRRIGVMQEMTSNYKRDARASFYQRSADLSKLEKELVETQIRQDTASAWFDLFYAQEKAKLISALVAQIKQEIVAVESAYQSNQGNQAAIYAVRSALVLAQDAEIENKQKIRNAQIQLTRWIGELNAKLVDAPNITQLPYVWMGEENNLHAKVEALPQIQILNQQTQIAQTEVMMAQANKHADWSIGAAFQQRNSRYGNMISVGVSIPLQWDQKNRQDKQLSAKLAGVEQSQLQRNDILREKSAQISSLMLNWKTALERIHQYETELAPLARSESAAANAAYSGGKLSLFELLKITRQETQVRIQTLQLQAQAAQLWAQLKFIFPEQG